MSNRDDIARPAKGKFFALSVPELLGLIRNYNFASDYRKQIEMKHVNFCCKNRYGSCVAAFYPRKAIMQCSFPEDFSPVRAKFIITSVVREFAELGKLPPSYYHYQWTGRGFRTISYRAYLGELNQLVITRCLRRVSYRKYRDAEKFSSVRCRTIRTKETIFRVVELI